MDATRQPTISFLDAPFVRDLSALAADFAFLGVPYGPAYDMEGVSSPASDGAEGVRRVVRELGWNLELDHYDFDCGTSLVPDGVRLVDCGDVVGDHSDIRRTVERSTAVVRAIVAAGAVPLVVGGDDAIPPIVARGFDGLPTLNVLHIDAHIDFRDELLGVRDGYSSPIRRLRDLPNIAQIVQVGLRGVGSGRRGEVEAALAAGNRLVTRRELRERGADAVMGELDTATPWFVTIDCDGLDPSVAPGVSYPEPDGLTFAEAAVLVRGLARSGSLVGVEFTEYVPSLDVRSLTAVAIARLLTNVIGLSPRPGGRS